jgi:hypothetical protein
MPASAQMQDKPAKTRRRGKKTAVTPLSRAGGAPPPPRLTDEVIAYLDSLTAANPAQVVCLGYGHQWGVLIPGRGRPQGWRSFRLPGAGGIFGIEEDCLREDAGDWCGTTRVSHTGLRGIFLDRGVHRQYKRDLDRWKVRPEGSKISRLDIIDYLTWTMGDELFESGEAEPAGSA